MSGHPIFAALYQRFSPSMEASPIGAARADLVSQATGVVVDLGAGIGLNLPHLGEAVTAVHLVEPDPHMIDRLAPLPASATVHRTGAEDLPLDDESVDTVVSTMTLCTVDDVPAALEEIRRVLRPGGRVLVLEHVRSDVARRGSWQDRLATPWGWVAGGCRPNRDTLRAFSAAGFDTSAVRRVHVPRLSMAWDWVVGEIS